MGFQNLAHVHTARNAQRVKHDLHGSSVGQERHVFLRKNLGDNTLVAVPAGHFVAHRNHALGGNVNLDHLQNTAAKLVAAFHRVELAVAGVDGRFDRRPNVVVNGLDFFFSLRTANVQILKVELLGLLGHITVLLSLDQRVVVLVGELFIQSGFNLADQFAESRGNGGVSFGLGRFERVFEVLAFFLRKAHAPRELLRVDDDPSIPEGTSSESFLTSSPARPKIACKSFSSGVSSVFDFGETLPTRMSPGRT